MEIPRIVSPDDHVVEPPDLWTSRLAGRFAAAAPRVVRERGRMVVGSGDNPVYCQDEDAPPVDVWCFEDERIPLTMVAASVGFERSDIENRALTYDEIRPGCYQKEARIADMDLAGIEASLCFPNMFTRFCGQRFLAAKDKELGLACVQAYNDFVLEDWCAAVDGRLIPCGIVPLWDVEQAARDVHANAERGMRAVSFSEMPPLLGLPSIHSGYWDPFFRACQATETVIMAHVGSSSQMTHTSPDAPTAVYHALAPVASAMLMVDWLSAAIPVDYPGLKLCLTESQVSWIPHFVSRLDRLWERSPYTGLTHRMPEPPSTYFRQGIYATFFEDAPVVDLIELIGPDNVLFETDYPHGDSSWPDCREVARRETAGMTPQNIEKVVNGNARRLFRLDTLASDLDGRG